MDVLYSSKDHLLDRYAAACPAGLYMRRSWSELGYEAWVCMSPLQAHLLAIAEYVQTSQRCVRAAINPTIFILTTLHVHRSHGQPLVHRRDL